jgi:hypothetical protein
MNIELILTPYIRFTLGEPLDRLIPSNPGEGGGMEKTSEDRRNLNFNEFTK